MCAYAEPLPTVWLGLILSFGWLDSRLLPPLYGFLPGLLFENPTVRTCLSDVCSFLYVCRIDLPDYVFLIWLCALFSQTILPEHDSVLYIDTDVLFLSPVDKIWSHFKLMNPDHIAGMSYESEDFSSSWYHRFAKHPFYRPYGLNSGVMLMNLTRMRRFGWNEQLLESILLKYRSKIVWGDQDIINIIFNEANGKRKFK